MDLNPTRGHEQSGTRPCLVISADKFNHSRAELVVVAPITTNDKRIPSHVRLEVGNGGLEEVSFVKCEEVRCISKDRLIRSVESVSPSTMADVSARVKFILDL